MSFFLKSHIFMIVSL